MESTTMVFGRILALYLLTSGVAFIVATWFYGRAHAQGR